MRRLAAQLYASIGPVLIALALAFAALQPAFTHPAPVPQSINMHSQHAYSTQVVIDCDLDCAGTVHNCCLYALYASPPLTLFQPITVQHSPLQYFFSSRQITPLTQPPKTV